MIQLGAIGGWIYGISEGPCLVVAGGGADKDLGEMKLDLFSLNWLDYNHSPFILRVIRVFLWSTIPVVVIL